MKNPFVPVYKELTQAQKDTMQEIKEKAMALYEAICTAFDSDPRCTSVAKTKLEEAVMWAVKGVANPPEISPDKCPGDHKIVLKECTDKDPCPDCK